MQQVAELGVVEPELIGQRAPLFTFMSAQQECFCSTSGAESLGITGVKVARLVARVANNIRTTKSIGLNNIIGEDFRKESQVDVASKMC